MMENNKKGFFGRLSARISEAFSGKNEVDEEFLDEMEEIIITSDIGMETTSYIMTRLREVIGKERVTTAEGVKDVLKRVMVGLIDKEEEQLLNPAVPLVILMIGINGGGKTTSIGKIGYKCKQEGKTVLLAAADTFRAAAADQLEIWGDRIGVNVIRHGEGADPSAVIYDAIQAAKARKIDVLICDTAGRLQTKKNLMNELEKMYKIIDREYPEAAKETLLVLDATTGKNAISQAKEFSQVAPVTGIVLTKLDGTAKGGIALTIVDEFGLPIKYIGVGEAMDDLREFNPSEFIGGIFDD